MVGMVGMRLSEVEWIAVEGSYSFVRSFIHGLSFYPFSPTSCKPFQSFLAFFSLFPSSSKIMEMR